MCHLHNERGESKPDFDKIIPICELFNIKADQLLKGEIKETKDNESLNKNENIKTKRALIISSGIFLYFLSIVLIICCEELNINEILGVSLFLITCGLATSLMVYQGLVYSNEDGKIFKKAKVTEEETIKKRKIKLINDLIATIILVIYLIISFTTMAWHITWIIWIVYAVLKILLNYYLN